MKESKLEKIWTSMFFLFKRVALTLLRLGSYM